MNKISIRKFIKKTRLNLSSDYVSTNSYAIQNSFLKNFDYFLQLLEVSNPVFSLYNSAFNEVDTSLIAEFLKRKNYKFCYPVIDQKNIKFGLYQNDVKFVRNEEFVEILEPKTYKFIDPDILIVPLIAFDANLNRIGMGKGFYDKAIKNLRSKKKIIAIGLAYYFQYIDREIETNQFDQKLDFVITEDIIYNLT